jgi:hypothetical protein
LAAIELEKEGMLPDILALSRQVPRLAARILGFLGKEAAVELYEGYLEKPKFFRSDITRSASGTPHGPSGRRVVTYSVGKGVKWVRVSSFPLNLFEGGRKLRSGAQEAPRMILRGKLKSAISGQMPGLLNEAEKLIVDDWFNSRHKGGMRTL